MITRARVFMVPSKRVSGTAYAALVFVCDDSKKMFVSLPVS